jgi:hypothetical protein
LVHKVRTKNLRSFYVRLDSVQKTSLHVFGQKE